MYEPRAVPLALLVVVVLQIAVTPGPERRSRAGYEAEADWVALQTTRDPRAAREAVRGAGRDEPRRPGPAGLGHTSCSAPIRPTMQRIAMAEAWQARHGRPRR